VTDFLIRAPRTLSIIPTFRCNANCTHCGTFSHPGDESSLPEDIAAAFIDEAADLRFANVVITGGEATLEWEKTVRLLEKAKTRGLPTRLVTNGQWAIDHYIAEARIRELLAAGLAELNLSTGDQHQRFVPIEQVALAANVATQFGLRTVVVVELIDDCQISEAHVRERMSPHPLLKIISSPWMSLGKKSTFKYPSGLAFNCANVASAKGCDSILQTYVVQADRKIASCCGLGVRRIDELHDASIHAGSTLRDAINRSEADLIKLLLRYIGPEKLVAKCASIEPAIDWENQFAHRCQACLRLYKDPLVKRTLLRIAESLLPDVVFAAYFDEVLAASIQSNSAACMADMAEGDNARVR